MFTKSHFTILAWIKIWKKYSLYCIPLLLFLKFCLHVFSSFSMLMNTNSCSLPTDWIACVTMRSSLICISHFSAEPAPERLDVRDLSAVVSFDPEGTPSLSLTMTVGSHKPTPLQVIAVNTHSSKASCEDYKSRILHYCASARHFELHVYYCQVIHTVSFRTFLLSVNMIITHTSNRWNLTKEHTQPFWLLVTALYGQV